MKKRLCRLLAALCLTGCGGALDQDAAYKVWVGLETAQVVAPIGLDSFYPDKNFLAPVRCGDGGEAMSSVLQTHAFSLLRESEPDGSASGAVDYVLGDCCTAGVTLTGTVHRTFYAAQRVGVQMDDQLVPGVVRLEDRFHGTVRLQGERAACPVEATRTITNGVATYEGELCGHALAPLLQERGHVVPEGTP